MILPEGIAVLFTKWDKKLSNETFENHLKNLPEKLQERICRFHRWQDRQAGLYGKLLLRKALTGCGCSDACLENLKFTRFGRPFMDHDIDINLSHSGEIAVCAVSKNGRVGIDIEKIKPVELSGFKKYILPEVWKEIDRSDEKENLFYDYWTMVESSLKADGRGFSLPIEEMAVNGNAVTLCGKNWYITRLDIGEGYRCCLASSRNEPELSVSEIRF
ncbi:MAG: 4'-phosphopantetheinyl transferase superfamily protein [Desulfobacterales bacterium]